MNTQLPSKEEIEDALTRIAFYEDFFFNPEKNHVLEDGRKINPCFSHLREGDEITMRSEMVDGLLEKLQKGEALFQKIKEQGHNEVSVPGTINFRPCVPAFSEYVNLEPKDRPSVEIKAYRQSAYIVTKSKVKTDTLIAAHKTVIAEVAKASAHIKTPHAPVQTSAKTPQEAACAL